MPTSVLSYPEVWIAFDVSVVEFALGLGSHQSIKDVLRNGVVFVDMSASKLYCQYTGLGIIIHRMQIA
jgi:hypothetical protein